MIGRMSGLDRDECAATGGAHFSVSGEFGFDYGAVVCGFDDARRQFHFIIGRSGPEQFDTVVGCDSAGRSLSKRASHQMIGGGPVRVAIQECPDDAAVEHARKSLMVLFRLPFANRFVAAHKAPDPQALLVRRPAAEAGIMRSILFLKTLFTHGD